MNIDALKEHFPKEAVSWRSQTISSNGSALALAYIDARDVMNRLDDVCGPENWQDEYDCINGRTICKIGLFINDRWVWKSDGAGDTQVEAEKGGISDAFKRAAVKWGVGRYLYDLPAVWVPCETYEKGGKKHFKAFKQDPWDFVKSSPAPPKVEPTRVAAGLVAEIGRCNSQEELKTLLGQDAFKSAFNSLPKDQKQRVLTEKDRRKEQVATTETINA